MKKVLTPLLLITTALVGHFFSHLSDANALDLTNGVWKNLDEQYDQSTNNPDLLSGSIVSRIYNNYTYDSSNSNNKYDETYLDSKLGLGLQLYKNLFIKTNVSFAQSPQYKIDSNGDDRFFQSQNLHLSELALNYNYKQLSLLAGKFDTNFGKAWEKSDGIWVNEIGREYQQGKKLGLGSIYRAGDKKTTGEYVFGLSVFNNDRSSLNDSLITDGYKPIATRNLQSYVGSLDIYYDFGNKELLSYHFAYLNLATDTAENSPRLIGDESGWTANMDYKYPVNDNFLINGFIEYAAIKNIYNADNIYKKTDFLTVNLTSYIFNDYYLTLARANRSQNAITTNIDSYFLDYKNINEISVGYNVNNNIPALNGLGVALGYKKTETDNNVNPVKNHAVGLMIKYKKEF